MNENYEIFAVGKIKKHRNSAEIEVYHQFGKALLGLDQFSHILVFFWFHRNDTSQKRKVLQVHPRGDRKNPLTGVFATRSPVRPNLIGLSICKILSIRNNVIRIDHIDAFNGTPVIDIKPCISKTDLVSDVRVPEWVQG